MGRDDIGKIARAFAQPVTCLGIGMLMFIYCALSYLLIGDRKDAEIDAKIRGSNLVRLADQSFSNIFQSIDASLLFLRKTYQQSSSTFDLNIWVHDPSIKNELKFDFTIVDANGRVVDSSVSKAKIGEDRSDREPFRIHVASATDKLYISKPFIQKSSGKWAVALTRPIATDDGQFAGVIAALVDVSKLGENIGKLDLGPDGSIALVGFDGVLRMRVVNGAIDRKNIGRKVPLTPKSLGRALLAQWGSYWSIPGVFNNIPRLVSFRVLESFPLIALVTTSKAEVYRRTEENARIYWGIALSLTAAILLAIGFGARRERRLIETTAAMKQAQESLSRSQERYTLVEGAVNDGIWDWNILTSEDYLSPRWKRILGYADDELPNVASSFFDLIHPDDKADVAEAVRAHLEEHKPYEIDLRLRCKNGEYRWVHSRGKAEREAGGRPVRMLGTITDITARKQAEATIEESRNNLARAEAMAHLGHFKFENGSGEYTWSEGVYGIMGKSLGSFTPTLSNSLELIHPDDRPTLKQYHLDVIAGIEVLRKTLRVVKDDGQIIYVEFWSTPIRASDGTVTGMFGTLQDVTARKNVEEMLAQEIRQREQAQMALALINQDLEARVAERTAELAQEMQRREEAQTKLVQVQKMEAVGQLTAGIAHDFNNLLAVIQGGVEFVQGAAARGLTAEPELIDATLRATRRGADLVQRLLAFSRQSPLKSEPTSVDQLVLDTLRLLQRTLGEQISIETRLDATASMVLVDRNQLTNALLNLALNARDAMPEGGQLAIATTCQPAKWAATEGAACWPTGEEVCITVNDTGAGMMDEVRHRVFEPFFTTKKDGLGTGLGLSMVHGFVQQSGGHIEIDSSVGRGTTISIHLPRIEETSQTAEFVAAAGSSATGREKTVLLVEDDPDVRIMTAAQLKQLGYKVHAAANGNEAIDVIESPASIDIMLTDIVLPGGLGGVTLVKEAMRARPGIGVLCMSGYDPSQNHRKWLQVQNIEFLEKPFSSAQLAQAFQAVLAA